QIWGFHPLPLSVHILEGQACFSFLENLWILLYSGLWWCWIPARWCDDNKPRLKGASGK
ncbi:unnamed protein product, partial [Brassica oleracea var. botrytis]